MMSDTSKENESGKAALKKLRESRQEQIAAATARMKQHRKAVKAIRDHLAGVELTVPEIAAATGLPPSEVLWYVASLKKFGEILEGTKAGDYYGYRLNERGTPEAEAGPVE
jgi:predicted transcriptional regulator